MTDIRVRTLGDEQNRIHLRADGIAEFGPGGSTAPDVELSRTAANTLGVASGDVIAADGFNVADGGTVTQETGITTGVTLNTRTGQITTVTGPSIVAGAEAAFTVTNSTAAATSIVLVAVATQFTDGLVIATVTAIAAGSFEITLANLGAAAVSAGAAVINFAVFGGSAT